MIPTDAIEMLLAARGSASATASMTSTTALRPTGTAAEIIAKIESAMRQLQPAQNALHRALVDGAAGYVLEHDFPPAQVPNRRHKKRRNQTEAYHRRVQKKWAKRWGTHPEQRAYMVDMNAMSLFPAARPRLGLVLPRGSAAAQGAKP